MRRATVRVTEFSRWTPSQIQEPSMLDFAEVVCAAQEVVGDDLTVENAVIGHELREVRHRLNDDEPIARYANFLDDVGEELFNPWILDGSRHVQRP
jgi:hypothetical protein